MERLYSVLGKLTVFIAFLRPFFRLVFLEAAARRNLVIRVRPAVVRRTLKVDNLVNGTLARAFPFLLEGMVLTECCFTLRSDSGLSNEQRIVVALSKRH